MNTLRNCVILAIFLINPLSVSAKTVTKTAILVDGIFTDKASWVKVAPLLKAHGLKTISVKTSRRSHRDDLAFTQKVIANADGDVILIGHSWAGIVMANVNSREKIKAMVYLSTFVPKENKRVRRFNEQASSQTEALVTYFAPDLSGADDTKIRQDTITQDTVTQDTRVRSAERSDSTPSTDWKSKPGWFIVTSDKQMLAPKTQRMMQKTIGATTVQLAASNALVQSEPEKVANAILVAASAN